MIDWHLFEIVRSYAYIRGFVWLFERFLKSIATHVIDHSRPANTRIHASAMLKTSVAIHRIRLARPLSQSTPLGNSTRPDVAADGTSSAPMRSINPHKSGDPFKDHKSEDIAGLEWDHPEKNQSDRIDEQVKAPYAGEMVVG